MRLINTSTLALSEFFGPDIPKYAILSHTWEKNGEVTYQQWIAPHKNAVKKKSGYQKILGACGIARRQKINWMWVDTNCIDKTSSSELSEAINSMFTWYHAAVECYVYMADVRLPEASDVGNHPTFRESKWFTRGWTLQELLAPGEVIFYSRDWVKLGSRDGGLLLQAISEVTGIKREALSSIKEMSESSVAAKMSWLSRRQTTREEDMAYCMLGIFDLNMPLLYGEGRKAFTRLQEEIIKASSDQSIFAWTWNDDVPSDWTSILAPSPSTFSQAANIFAYSKRTSTSYSITNVGLSIELPLAHSFGNSWISLDIWNGANGVETLCIPVRRRDKSFSGLYCRCDVPKRPMLLPGKYFQQEGYLYLESRPSRFMAYTGAVLSNTPRMHSSFKFGLLCFLEEKHKPGMIVSTMPEDAMDHSGIFRFGNSSRSQASVLMSLLIYTNSRQCVYVGVRPNASQKTRGTAQYVWYLTSWSESLSRGSAQHKLDKIDSVIVGIEYGNRENVIRRDGLKIFADVGEDVNLGTTGQGRIVRLDDDFQPKFVHLYRPSNNASKALADNDSFTTD